MIFDSDSLVWLYQRALWHHKTNFKRARKKACLGLKCLLLRQKSTNCCLVVVIKSALLISPEKVFNRDSKISGLWENTENNIYN